PARTGRSLPGPSREFDAVAQSLRQHRHHDLATVLGNDLHRSGAIDRPSDSVDHRLAWRSSPDHALDEVRRDAAASTGCACRSTEAARLHSINSVLGVETIADLRVLPPVNSDLRVVGI